MTESGLRVRQPAVAGAFYPGNRDALLAEIDRAFADSVRPEWKEATPSTPGPPPRALIVPHAGYVYSGAVAASAFSLLSPHRHAIRRVVLLGPSHRVFLNGIGVTSADAWDTPLGRVPIDDSARSTVLAVAWVRVDDRAHAPEHSLEVELPFLQTVLDDFVLLPLVVGDATDTQVADTIDIVWDGPDTVVVVSTDLSHYLPHDEAMRRDTRTADAIVANHPSAIAGEDACGNRGLRGLLVAARRRDLDVRRIDLRNSGDTAGNTERVVGYGAFAIF